MAEYPSEPIFGVLCYSKCKCHRKFLEHLFGTKEEAVAHAQQEVMGKPGTVCRVVSLQTEEYFRLESVEHQPE